MIVLDTTILAYAVGAQHPLQQPCLRLLERVRARSVGATTTVEVIQELVHVLSRRRARADAAGLARNFVRLLAPLIAFTSADLVDGLNLFESRADLGSFDSVLAAACLRRSAQLASADRAFGNVPGLAHVVPGTEQFEALLR